MRDAIRTISLDDVGEPAGEATQARNKALQYSPQYNPNTVSNSRPFPEAPRSFTTSFSRFTVVVNAERRRKLLLWVLILLGLGSGAYLYLDTEGLLEGFWTAEETMVPTSEVTGAALPKPAPAPEPEVAPVQETEKLNPYWTLPNPLEVAKGSQPEPGASLVESWRFGLTHPYVYQRYKTVKAMRGGQGSESVLRDALAQPKFWTRMEALLGLAELGEELDVETVQAAFKDVRKDLARNYFRRFSKRSDAASLYVMRQAVRVVDAGVREIIITNLARHRNPTNDLYLIAASHDPNGGVQALAQQELRARPAASNSVAEYQQAVTAQPEPKPETPKVETQDLKVEKIPAENVNIEEVYFLNEEAQEQLEEVAPIADPQQDDGFKDLESAP